jgi:hypothetical protein
MTDAGEVKASGEVKKTMEAAVAPLRALIGGDPDSEVGSVVRCRRRSDLLMSAAEARGQAVCGAQGCEGAVERACQHVSGLIGFWSDLGL